MDSYKRHDLSTYRFLRVFLKELTRTIKQHCILNAPGDMDSDIVDHTNYLRFFLEEKSGKIYTRAEALARIDNRVFSLKGTIDLAHDHLKNVFDTTRYRIDLKDGQMLAREAQLRQCRLQALASSQGTQLPTSNSPPQATPLQFLTITFGNQAINTSATGLQRAATSILQPGTTGNRLALPSGRAVVPKPPHPAAQTLDMARKRKPRLPHCSLEPGARGRS